MKKYQLPKEFATKWIEALRSGVYGQAKGVLKVPYKNEYCCLGVACKIAGAKKFSDTGYIPLSGVPRSIHHLLRGCTSDSSFVKRVAAMNDTGKSFKQIADWIENNVEFTETI